MRSTRTSTAHPRRLAATVLGSSMAFIDSSVINVALPAIQRDLQASAGAVQWLVSGYQLTLGAFVLRIPGVGTSEYISRENESLAARITSEIGVNAPLIYFDARDGVQLTRFVEGGVTMNADRFKDLGSVRRAAQSLKRVHDCGRPFRNRYRWPGG